MKKLISVVVVWIMLLAGPGCSVFLPAHDNSNFRNGEEVRITLMTNKDLEPYMEEYELVFGPPRGEAVGIGAVAAIVASLAVDYTKKELKKEAGLYEAQFKRNISDDEFWEIPDGTTKYNQHYIGVKVERRVGEGEWEGCDLHRKSVSDSPPLKEKLEDFKKEFQTKKKECAVLIVDSTSTPDKWTIAGFNDEGNFKSVLIADTGDELYKELKKEAANTRKIVDLVTSKLGRTQRKKKSKAFELVLGLHPSKDGQMFRMAPLYLKVSKAKAKVLSDKVYTWLLPWTWVGKAIRIPGHEIDLDISIQIDAYWKDEKQNFNVDRVAAFSFEVSGYDLNESKALKPGNGLAVESGGWLLGMPVSLNDKKILVGFGTFTLTAMVTEKDTSNAKKYLEQAANLVGENKEKIIKLIPTN